MLLSCVIQSIVAQFLAVCRRSKMMAMGTRRPRRGSRLCRRWALQWSEDGQLLGQYLRATKVDKLSEQAMPNRWFFIVMWNCGEHGRCLVCARTTVPIFFLANLSGKVQSHLFPYVPSTLSACRVENLNGICKKIFEGKVPRFFPLHRYKIRVCLLPLLYHNYTDHI